MLYNEAFGRVLIPCLKLTLGIFTVTSIYSAIKLLSVGNPIVTLILFLFFGFGVAMQLFLYPMAGRIHEMSLTLSMFSGKPQTQYEAALRRAFVPMSITSGSFYIIHSKTTLTYVSAIVTTTIGMLII